MTALCVCGLAAEARIARRAGFDAVVGSAGIGRADLLISFGIAGGLAPHLRAGDVILSGEIVTEDGVLMSDRPIADWATAIGAIQGKVLGARGIVATRRDKARAWAATGALAVDLESEAVARAATAAGVSFLVLRAIADPAARDLPPAALLPLTGDGRPELARVLASVLCRPGQIPGLIGLARDARRALAALVGPAGALHRLLGGV